MPTISATSAKTLGEQVTIFSKKKQSQNYGLKTFKASNLFSHAPVFSEDRKLVPLNSMECEENWEFYIALRDSFCRIRSLFRALKF